MLSLIGRYFHHIRSLDCQRNISRYEQNLQFFLIKGHKLEGLFLNESNEMVKQILEFCPNLKRLNVRDKIIIFNENKEFLPKLQEFSLDFHNSNEYFEDIIKFKILVDKYSQTKKTFKLMLCGLTEEEPKTCIEYITRFENLQSLTLKF